MTRRAIRNSSGVVFFGALANTAGFALLFTEPFGIGFRSDPLHPAFADNVGRFVARLHAVPLGAAVLPQREPLVDSERRRHSIPLRVLRGID